MNNNRIKITLCDGWEFSLSERNEWESVTLPHTWNAADGCDGGTYYRGRGIYRRVLSLNEHELKKQIFMEFEGANTITELYVNDVFAGKHEGGYSLFRFDITSLVKTGENSITVIVDNSPTDYIAPIMEEGDFTKMGGLYRNVNLILTDRLHIDLMDCGSSGIYITPRTIREDYATLYVSVKIRNDNPFPVTAQLHSQLFDREEEFCSGVVYSYIHMKPYSEDFIRLNLRFHNVHLWNGIDDPYLYTLRTRLTGDRCCDEVNVTTGLRRIKFGRNNELLLNGKPVFLKGVNYHQDFNQSGWAMTDSQRETDYEKIAELGANAVRMAHYQHCELEYDICDRLGLAVWSEIPLINRTTVGEEKHLSTRLYDNLKIQLIEMIRQNYNHPSVFFWGISNELYDVDAPTIEIYEKLVKCAKSEDGSRSVIYADNTASDGTRLRSHSADAVGYNRYDGWYYSHLGGMSKWIKENQSIDHRPTCVSEYGCAGALSQHMDNPTQEDIDPNGLRHYEEYQTVFHEKTWSDLSGMDSLFGAFIWCMFDFASDSRIEGDTCGQNDKGLMTRNRIPKDSYFFYKSVWNSEPMIHLTSKRFTHRPSLIPTVKAYSNCPSAELFVNGISCGITERTDSTVFKWDNIQIEKGASNTIKVVAYDKNGAELCDCVQWFGL